MKPKVLIGCPTYADYSYTLGSYLKAISKIDYDNYELLMVDNSADDSYYNKLRKIGVKAIKAPYFKDPKKRIVESRNKIRDYAIKNDFDYFLSLEQDIIVPPDVITKLLSHEKDIVSAFYTILMDFTLKEEDNDEEKKAYLPLPVVYFLDGDGMLKQANSFEVVDKGLISVGATGVGCMLISKKVFSEIRFRYEEGKKAFDDIFFCSDARKKGYEIFLDSDLKVEHRHN